MTRHAAFSSFWCPHMVRRAPTAAGFLLATTTPHTPVPMDAATPPEVPPAPLTWRAHAAALFVTFHLVCVFLYALPRPPVLDPNILEHPEVKAELDEGFGALHRVIPWRDRPEQMRDDVFRVVTAYTRFTDRLRGLVSPYLDTAGSTQSWHMFGGTPHRSPLVFVVEVQPQGESSYILLQDLH